MARTLGKVAETAAEYKAAWREHLKLCINVAIDAGATAETMARHDKMMNLLDKQLDEAVSKLNLPGD